MSRASLSITTVLLCTLLAACGGGSGYSSTPAAATGNTTSATPASTASQGASSAPTASTSSATPTGSGSSTGSGTTPGSSTAGGSGNGTGAGSTAPASPTPFIANVTIAPADGATLSGTVTLEVRGSSLENVELLPPSGYSPRLGVFTVTADKTSARLDFDSRTLPNGTLLARISAFNMPAGSSGASEIVAMQTRTWLLRNDPEPAPASIPSASYMPEVRITLEHLPFVDPQFLAPLRQMDDATFANTVANDWPRVEAILRMYIPVNVVFMPPSPLNFQNALAVCMREPHSALACRETMIYLPR